MKEEKYELNISADDWNDLNYLKKLMKEYHDKVFEPFYGVNDYGEDITISINEDNIALVTYQENHWIRKNIYWSDGTVEETFDGRW